MINKKEAMAIALDLVIDDDADTLCDGIGLDHNHQVGVGTSGELNLSTNAATDGSIKAWGHTVYDSDNQGEFGNNQIGGHWNSSSLVNLNYIRLVSSHTNFTPDTGYVYILKLNN